MRTKLHVSLLAAIVVAAALSAADDQDQAKAAKKPAAKQPDKNTVVAIVGGDVYTVTREVIRAGTVLVKDGKILRVGQDIPVPEGATVIDAKGKYVTPGYVALSMAGVGVQGAGQGRGQGGPPQPAPTANSKLADTLDPFDRNIKFCLGVGITTGCVELSGGGGRRFGRDGLEDDDNTQVCPCCGLAILPFEPIAPRPPTTPTARRHAVLKMTFGDLDSMLIKEGPFYHLPSTGLAGALNHFNWRETIKQARKYLADQAAHEKAVAAGEESRPPRKTVADEVISLVKKEAALRTDASSTSQIRDMLRLAKELDYHIVLEDAFEAWLLADELAEAKAAVVLAPRGRRQHALGREDSSGSSIETSAYLEKAGVPFAVATQMNTVSLDGVYGGRDLTGLSLEAAFAVRGGCSEKTALAGLTIVPARLLGLEQKIGSIEEGKDADLLIQNGPPLDYRTSVQTVFVKGKVYYEHEKEHLYPAFERNKR